MLNRKINVAMKFFAGLLNVSVLPIVFASNGPEKIEAQLRFDKAKNLPKFIEIFVRAEDKIIENLAHEMKHCQDFLSGKLRFSNGKFFWNGVENNQTNYFFQPWEIEARVFAREAVVCFNRYWRERQFS